MANSSKPIIITLLVIVALAIVVLYFGPSIWDSLRELHG
jgi:hypothetical protein